MKVLNMYQLHTVDQATMNAEQISSLQLMEKVAERFCNYFCKNVNRFSHVLFLCGMGNNGGDGLALARLLYLKKKFPSKISVAVVRYRTDFSADAQVNFDTLPAELKSSLVEIHSEQDFENLRLSDSTLLVDALLGTGTNRPVEGLLKAVIEKMNQLPNSVISLDVPSGLYIDQPMNEKEKVALQANLVLTIETPKLAFFMPENAAFVPDFHILNIPLDKKAQENADSTLEFLEEADIRAILEVRPKFSHKGIFGHGLLFAGSRGKSGAALIAAEACLRSGAGLLTVHATQNVVDALAVRLPETMTEVDENQSFITYAGTLKNYRAVGFGSGVGTQEETARVLNSILKQVQANIVIDADGLNILAENKTWLEFLPYHTILTPHPKEFERLVGHSFKNSFDRLEEARNFAQKYGCILVLKDAYTSICLPNGQTFFNSTGNAGLAKGGSGDALTGILLGLLTRGYHPVKATIIGVFVHGLAADLCAEKTSQESFLISDVIQKLGRAFRKLEE